MKYIVMLVAVAGWLCAQPVQNRNYNKLVPFASDPVGGSCTTEGAGGYGIYGTALYICDGSVWVAVSGGTTQSGTVVRTDSTHLTIAEMKWAYPGMEDSCSATNVVLTLASGAGEVRVWGGADCEVKYGITGTASVSSTTSTGTATSMGTVSAFPPGVVRIVTWNATAGAYDSTAMEDERVTLVGPQQVAAGTGILLSDSGVTKTVAIDQAVLTALIQAVSANGCTWASDTIGYADISTAGTTNSAMLVSAAAANTVVHAVRIKHSAAFTGGSVSAMTVSVGIDSDTSAYSNAFNIFQAPGDTVMRFDGGAYAPTAASHDIEAYFTSTGANLSDLTAGSVKISLCTAVIP